MIFKAKSCLSILMLDAKKVNSAVCASAACATSSTPAGEGCTATSKAAHENTTKAEGQRERLDSDDSPEQYACKLAPPGKVAPAAMPSEGGASYAIS